MQPCTTTQVQQKGAHQAQKAASVISGSAWWAATMVSSSCWVTALPLSDRAAASAGMASSTAWWARREETWELRSNTTRRPL